MERVSKPEDRSTGTKTQDKQGLTNLWDCIKMSNKCIIGIPEREDRVTDAEKGIKFEQYPKCNEKHQYTNPRGSVNFKENKCKTTPMQAQSNFWTSKIKGNIQSNTHKMIHYTDIRMLISHEEAVGAG